jgi:uncharacterized protein GlcG (DUF336 family)
VKPLLLALFAVECTWSQPVLHTEVRNGVERAMLRHTSTGEKVSDENPAVAGETLAGEASGVDGALMVHIGGAQAESAAAGDGTFHFVMPEVPGGSFVEIALKSDGVRSNAASIPVHGAEDAVQLSAAEVQGLVIRAALAVDSPTLAIAIVDRAGRPLAIYRRPQATEQSVETALGLARTGAFFSHNQAPLSSRTIRFLSTENFPEGIPNQPAAALFGIENTNRGCVLSASYLPGQAMPRSLNAAGTGPGIGVVTVPGGIPIYRDGYALIGGIGAAGVTPEAAEFAALSATFGTPFFIRLPLPAPGAVFVDGFRLPFVTQTTRPAGFAPATTHGGAFDPGYPRAGAPSPDGWLVGPSAGTRLSVSDVRSTVERAIARAERTRSQIRLPLGSRTRMVLSVADLDGTILALYRMPDATVFSVDVAATKARNVVYFSGPLRNASDLPGVPPLTAVSNRTVGFGSQSYFPSGIHNSNPGPFRPLYEFDRANPCTQGFGPRRPNESGIVFFPGSAPLYNDGQMVGGLGVSGDGVEQDDYVTAAGAQGLEAPDSRRADRVFIPTPLGDVRLPYWKFPRNPEQ